MSERVARIQHRLVRPHLVVAIALALPAAPSLAITWTNSEVEDPIAPERTCLVHEPTSYGSYIYNWPSKYDFVFWPFTDPGGIWHCKHTGFTALIGDFEDLSDSEIVTIRTYLATNYDGNDDLETRLTLLEGIYGLREKEPHFRNTLLRVLAQLYLRTGNLDRANGYRKTAFEQIKAFLDDDLPDLTRFEYLYLAANYARQFGDAAASDRYLAELEETINANSDPELSGYVGYLAELAKETPLIRSGGRLAPVLE